MDINPRTAAAQRARSNPPPLESINLAKTEGLQRECALSQEEMKLLTAFRAMGEINRGMVLGLSQRLSFTHVNEKPALQVIHGGKGAA